MKSPLTRCHRVLIVFNNNNKTLVGFLVYAAIQIMYCYQAYKNPDYSVGSQIATSMNYPGNTCHHHFAKVLFGDKTTQLLVTAVLVCSVVPGSQELPSFEPICGVMKQQQLGELFFFLADRVFVGLDRVTMVN